MPHIVLTNLVACNTEEQFFIPGSKSISQRVLVIHYLSDLNNSIENLSDSDDTTMLYNALYSGKSIINVKQSGTALRFLMSVFSLRNINVVLTGSKYLFQRPIMPLIKLLNLLGGSVHKEKNQIHIKDGSLVGSALNFNLMYTSQFVSSLLLISPYLKNGLTLNLPKQSCSQSYIQMTISIMKYYGAKITVKNNSIHVSNQKYSNSLRFIESDWTSSSYLFLAFIFSKLSRITISTLYENSIQSDKVVVDFFALIGVRTLFYQNNIMLEKVKNIVLPKKIEWDFIDNPDLFPTILVACFGLGIELVASGLTTLPYKESNRIITMQKELSKFNCLYRIKSEEIIYMTPNSNNHIKNKLIWIDTHNDHRIALALAPLVLLGWKLKINNPDVITKSYANFWSDLIKFGIEIKKQ